MGSSTPDSKTILIAAGSNGLIKMDAGTLLPTGFLPGDYQSIVVRPPNGFTQALLK